MSLPGNMVVVDQHDNTLKAELVQVSGVQRVVVMLPAPDLHVQVNRDAANPMLFVEVVDKDSRVAELEDEVAALQAACKELDDENKELSADAAIGRSHREAFLEANADLEALRHDSGVLMERLIALLNKSQLVRYIGDSASMSMRKDALVKMALDG